MHVYGFTDVEKLPCKECGWEMRTSWCSDGEKSYAMYYCNNFDCSLRGKKIKKLYNRGENSVVKESLTTETGKEIN